MQVNFSDTGEGTPVIFVHGFPLDSRMWQGQSVLREKARLIRLDLPGFGDTPPTGSPASMATYSRAVASVMEAAGLDRAVLCGLSMGGYVLFDFWRRFADRVAGLVLCDTRAEEDTGEGRRKRLESTRLVRQGQRDEVTEGMLPKLLTPESRQRREVLQLVRSMNRRCSDEGLVAALQAMHDRPDSQPTLETIRVPTLVMVGTQDELTPPETARHMSRRIGGSNLVQIPHAAHLSPLENPEAFNAALLELLG
jgi:pimeloyl-ACP methyl ester carboxylesterase